MPPQRWIHYVNLEEEVYYTIPQEKEDEVTTLVFQVHPTYGRGKAPQQPMKTTVGTCVVQNIPLRCSKVINHPKSDSCIVLGILWSKHSKENQGQMSNKPKPLAKPKVFLFLPSGFLESRSGSVFQFGSQFQLSGLLPLRQKWGFNLYIRGCHFDI